MEAGIFEIAIFCFVLYWLCPSFVNQVFCGLTKMVDIVTNRMFDTFNRLSPSQNRQTDSLSSLSGLKRFSRDQRYKKAISREADIKNRESFLYDVKENISDAQISKNKTFTGLSCEQCTITSRESHFNKTTEKMAVKNMFTYTPCNKQEGFFEKIFSDIFQVINFKKYKFERIDKSVLEDQRVKDAILTASREQLEDSDKKDEENLELLLKSNRKRARKLLDDMKSAISNYFLSCVSWLLQKISPCFISSILVHPGQISMVKEASKTGLPLIFLPLHRSHLDYILITFILLNNSIKSPIVAAGDNLRLPFFGGLLRGLGAFYIKRRVASFMGRKDHVYKAILSTYVNHSLKAGHNIEFFIEGGRTRTGKANMPKYGIFSCIVEAFLDGSIEDALLVPVSINYDKLVDGNFIKEQMGEPKQIESFGTALKALWHVVNSDYGMTKVDFNQPFSLRELVKSFKTTLKEPINGKVLKSTPSLSNIYETDGLMEQNKFLIENISKHVVFDSIQSTSIMATSVLAFLLLNKFRNGGRIDELARELDELRTDLRYARKDIAFQGDSRDVINYAVGMLGPHLVKKAKEVSYVFVRPVISLPNVIELNYYSNSLVPHYAIDSIIAISCSVLSAISTKIEYEQLMVTTLKLCDILQNEFIFCKPCQSLEQTLASSIDDLRIRKHIFISEATTDLESRSRRIARQFDDDADKEQFAEPVYYTINQDSKPQEYLNFLCGITLPLIECYAVTAISLLKLVGQTLLEKELIKEIMLEFKSRLSDNSIKYNEAVSVDTIKNALKLYHSWNIVDFHTEDRLKIYCLKETSDNPEAILLLYEKIDSYRKNCK